MKKAGIPRDGEKHFGEAARKREAGKLEGAFNV